MRHLPVALAVLVVVVGCAGKKPRLPADKLRADADQAYADDAYELAVERYKALLDQYPFDPGAEEAELRIAMSHYRAGRYAEAIAALGDFERMHPTSPSLAMVEYHLGMAYMAQGTTRDRDTGSITNALNYFRNLLDRFPGTEWADRASLRVVECRELLAGHEAVVGAYYLKMGNLLAAESRLSGLLTNYPETEASADLLLRFAHAYQKRDEKTGQTLALATLVYHHPDGPLASQARTELTEAGGRTDGPDPLPELLALLDQNKTASDRKTLPRPVSAYPEGPPGGRPY